MEHAGYLCLENFKSVSWQVRAELRRSLKSNQDYKKLRWNRVERILIACTTHYIRAMLVLWSAAFGVSAWSNIFALYYNLSLCSIFKGITTLSGWMSNLLGSQLTIIGIVFPLVVGLISVLFQKISKDVYSVSVYQLIPDICLLV
jgi:hypothetical protein